MLPRSMPKPPTPHQDAPSGARPASPRAAAGEAVIGEAAVGVPPPAPRAVPPGSDALADAPSPGRGRRARLWLLAGGALVCLAYLAAELTALGGHLGWPLDDSWIHLQFARNLAAGRGLSYNPGELVTGSTAPLWTALLALLAYLPGDPFAWVQLAGALLYLAGIDAAHRLARELGLTAGLAALAGGLTLGTGWLAWSALSGMEVPLFVALSLWGIILHLRERAAAAGSAATAAAAVSAESAPPAALRVPPLAPAVLALAALARPEGLLLLALALFDSILLWRRRGSSAPAGSAASVVGPGADLASHAGLTARLERRLTATPEVATVAEPGDAVAGDAAGPDALPGSCGAAAQLAPLPEALAWRRPALARLAMGGLLALCVLVGPLLFYRLAGGSFLPTTYAAKGGELRRWLPDLQYVYGILGIFVRSQPYLTLLAPGGIALLVGRLGTRRDRGVLPGLWLAALPLAYSTLSPPGSKMLAGNFGRYYFPLFPVVVIVGMLPLESAAATLRHGLRLGRLRLSPKPIAALLVALLLWPTAADLLVRAGFYARNLQNVDQSDVRAAQWLAPRLPPDAVLAVNDIGAFKYLLPNRVVDLAGIANPELRREVAARVAQGVPWHTAMSDAVARRRPDYIAIFPAWLPSLAADLSLRPILRLRIQGNITMGSDELAIYATPWTRYPLHRLPGDPE